MNKLMLIFVAVVAVAYATEDCFDLELTKKDWMVYRTECIEKIPEGSADRLKKVGGCMMKKAGFLSEEGVLDFDKLKGEYERLKTRDIDHVIEALQKTWDDSEHDAGKFFDAWAPQLHELCPDSVQWAKDI